MHGQSDDARWCLAKAAAVSCGAAMCEDVVPFKGGRVRAFVDLQEQEIIRDATSAGFTGFVMVWGQYPLIGRTSLHTAS